MRKRSNIAVIMAAGKGTRLGASIPKQFLELGDGWFWSGP